MTENRKLNFWADWGMKILSVLVIPIAIWAATLHSNVAVMEQKLKTQDEELEALKIQSGQVNENENTLIRLETEMKNANGKLDEIKRALASP